jgi:hypothetical protein
MTIHNLAINSGALTMTVSVEVDAGNTVNKILAWNKDTYKVTEDAIDLTSLLAGTDETEDFTISAADLGVEQISGFWAVEFFSSDSGEESKTGIAINLLPYYECVVNKSLAISVKNCKVEDSKCGKIDTLLFANTLLENTHHTVLFGLYEETIQILDTLEDICEICTACPDYGTDLTHTGYGYKTENNVIILA